MRPIGGCSNFSGVVILDGLNNVRVKLVIVLIRRPAFLIAAASDRVM